MKTALYQRLIIATLVGILAVSSFFTVQAQSPSNVDTLGSLTVSPEDIIGFKPDRTEYSVGVPPTAASAAIIATPTDSNATVAFSGQDADTETNGYQVNLSVGLNTFQITVTAEDGISTKEYTLHIGRGSDEPSGWKAQDDLDGLSAAGNDSPQGIWGNSTTIWVVDSIDAKVYAYNRDGTEDTDKTFQLDNANTNPTGIWSDSTTMWVADNGDDKLFAYTLSNGTRDESEDISVTSVADKPAGIWSDETTMWVLDTRSKWIYAYTLSDGTRNNSQDRNVSSETVQPSDIWCDGTTIWVVSQSIVAWDLASGDRAESRDITLPTNVGLTQARNIWSDGATLWVGSLTDGKVYAFDLPSYDPTLSSLTVSPEDVIGFDPERTNYAAGMASTVSSATISAIPADDAATVAFSVSDADVGADGHQINLESGLNRVTVTVTAGNGTATMEYVLDLARGSADPLGWKAEDDLDGLIAAGNTYPYGIWGNTNTLWIVDFVTDKVYAYNRDGTADTSKEFQLDSSNSNAGGIWSNGEIMWVADRLKEKIFAYELLNRTRLDSRDISVENLSPRGIWSDGDTMWVFDANDKDIYAYFLSDGERNDSEDLDLGGVLSVGSDIWSDGTTMWVLPHNSLNAPAWNLMNKDRNEDEDIAFPTDTGLTKPIGLWSDGQTMWVTSGVNDKAYAFNDNVAPAFAAETATRSVDEGSAAGSDVGAAVTATDGDGDALTYTLGGTDGASFAIAATGQITVGTGTTLNYETKSSYAVVVTVADPSLATDTIAVAVSVNNLDEAGTVTLSSTAPRKGIAVTASLTDPDGGITGTVWQWANSEDGVPGTTSAGRRRPATRRWRGTWARCCAPRRVTPTTRAGARARRPRPARWGTTRRRPSPLRRRPGRWTRAARPGPTWERR